MLHNNNNSNEEEPNSICFLDSTFQSNLLRNKIADIPKRTRLEIQQYLQTNPDENFRTIYPNCKTLTSKMFTRPIYNQPPYLLDKKRDYQLLKSLALIFPVIVYHIPELSPEKDDSDKWITEIFDDSKPMGPYITDSLQKDKQLAPFITKFMDALDSDDSIKYERDLILEIVKDRGLLFRFLKQKYKNDFEILCAATKSCPFILAEIDNLPFLKYWMEEIPYHFEYLKYPMQYHHDLILICIKKKSFVDDDLNEGYFTPDLVIEALKEGYKFVPRKFAKEKSVFRQAVKMKPSLFELADKCLKCDKDFITELIEIDPLVMIYVNELLRDDLDIAKSAVKKNGLVLQYFTQSIRENEEIVTIAVNQNPKSIEFSLIQTIEIVMQVLESDGMCLQFINSYFKELKQVILTAVKSNGHSYKFIDNSLKVDRDIVIESLCNGCPYFQIDSKLRIDKEISIIALKNDSRAFKYIDQSIRNDLQILKALENSKSNWCINL